MTHTVQMTDEQYAEWNAAHSATNLPTTVHVTFVLDRSGSMETIRGDVLGGFNGFVDDQKAQAGECLLTLHQFDSGGFDTLHSARPIGEIPHAGPNDFRPRGMTPLFDAIGRAITEAQVRSEQRKGAGEAAEQQIVVILTDGQENSSREYTREQVFNLIRAKEAEGWIFTYLGANQDSYAVAHSLGFSGAATQDFLADSGGTRAAYASVSGAVTSTRGRLMGGQSVRSESFYAESGKAADEDKKARKA